MLFDHSILGVLTTLAGGSEHVFGSFYARGFDHFGGWIGACFFYHSMPWLLTTLRGGSGYVF